MRLPAEQVKEGILHERQMVRDLALRYFTDAYSRDPGVMPRAVEAIETHGWHESFDVPGSGLADLVQTEPTLLWAMEQVEAVAGEETLAAQERCVRLGALICWASVELLARHHGHIAELPGLDAEYKKVVADRLRLVDRSAEDVWDELVDWCERAGEKGAAEGVEPGHTARLVEALGRQDAMADQTMAVLGRPSGDLLDEPVMGWLEPYMVRLAGLLQLDAAIPHLVDRLWVDDTWLREQCVESLARIGSDETAGRIAERFSASKDHCKLWACAALASMRSLRVVAAVCELAAVEKDPGIKQLLAEVALYNAATEGIELALPLVRYRESDLRRPLLAVSLLTGTDFPERSDWLRAEEADEIWLLEHRKSIFDSPRGLGRGRRSPFEIERPEPPETAAETILHLGDTKEPGRNDPCPCGSGKKYKKCCLRKH